MATTAEESEEALLQLVPSWSLDKWAALLGSSNPKTLAEGGRLLNAWAEGMSSFRVRPLEESEEVKERKAAAAKMISKIAAYEKGAVLQSLWKNFLLGLREPVDVPQEGTSPLNPLMLSAGAGSCLASLASSRLVAKKILAISGDAQTLVRAYTKVLEAFRTLPILALFMQMDPGMAASLAALAFRGLSQFGRASTEVRGVIRQHAEIFSLLRFFLSPAYRAEAKAKNPQFDEFEVMFEATFFLHSMAHSKDMHTWLLDQGVIRVIADMVRTHEGPFTWQPIVLVNLCLSALLQSEAFAALAYQRGALSTLKPVLQPKFEAHTPGVWEQIEALLVGAEGLNAEERARRSRLRAQTMRETPKMCAWKDCSAMEVTPQVTLSRCSKCKLVYYCGREHQKLDYKEHKTVCN